jgi:hypothetical protein
MVSLQAQEGMQIEFTLELNTEIVNFNPRYSRIGGVSYGKAIAVSFRLSQRQH